MMVLDLAEVLAELEEVLFLGKFATSISGMQIQKSQSQNDSLKFGC
jgi:hypothetical protein